MRAHSRIPSNQCTKKGQPMDIIETIERRISCRAFTSEAIPDDILAAIQHEIDAINEESGLHFQLYGPREDGTALDLSKGMFASDAPCYAALAAQDDAISREKLGYYGERLVLFITQLGLGTCWVAGTFDRKTTRVELAEGEKLHDVIPIGFAPEKTPLKQRTIRKALRKRDKELSDLWQAYVPYDQAPEWVQACIEAVRKGPSAINGQPYVFTQDAPDAPIRAGLSSTRSGLVHTDLGIAKYHFEVVAAECGIRGSWEWGAGGAFIIKA